MVTSGKGYFYVESASLLDSDGNSQVLKGHDFSGGLSASSAGMYRQGGELFVVSTTHSARLTGKILSVHRCGVGYQLYLSGAVLPFTPCLLTDDIALKCIYSGPALIHVRGFGSSLDEAIAGGMPLVGEGWLGIVRLSPNGGFAIEVYSWQSVALHDNLKAYCPWWSGNLDDEQGVFMVSWGG